MKNLSEKRKQVLRFLFTILVVLSFVVTACVGVFFITNYQNIGKMLEVAAVIKTQYIEKVPGKQIMSGAVRGMVEALEDPYSVYLDQEEYAEFRQHIEGSIGGIGVYVSAENDKFLIFSVIEDTPASKAGLLKGDIIFKVDQKLVSEMDLDEAVAKMRGEPGTKVEISVFRDGEIKDFTVTRAIIDVPTVESQVLPGKIGYLQLKLFASNSDEALSLHLAKLKQEKIRGLVLDLRDNPGGDLEAAVNIARYFIPEGPVVHIVNKNGRMETMLNNQPIELGVPLVVLINNGSASASEVLAGAIKDTETGVLVGEKTFGKALVQVLIELRGKDAIKLTTAKYLTPKQHDIQAKGIIPDIEVSESETGQDLQLHKALEILRKQLNSQE